MERLISKLLQAGNANSRSVDDFGLHSIWYGGCVSCFKAFLEGTHWHVVDVFS